MANMIFLYALGCATTAVITTPQPPVIKPAQTSSLHSELEHHVLLAYIFESQKQDFDKVEEEWKKAMTYSYCDPELHLGFADMAHRYNQIDIAISQWERAIICIGWKDQDRRQHIQQKISLVGNQ